MARITNSEAQVVYQAKAGGDRFIVLDKVAATVTLYVTVETLLRPTHDAFLAVDDQPYYWSDETGMMYVLKQVAQENYLMHEEPDILIEEMETRVETL